MREDEEIDKLRGAVKAIRNDMDRRNRPILLPDGARVMQVTTRIPPAVGLGWKKGQAIDGTLVLSSDGNTLTFTPGTGDPRDVWNMHEKGFQVGGLILALNVSGRDCAFDVDACGNYR